MTPIPNTASEGEKDRAAALAADRAARTLDATARAHAANTPVGERSASRLRP